MSTAASSVNAPSAETDGQQLEYRTTPDPTSDLPVITREQPLHYYQLPIDRSNARFKIVAAGRRFGKTRFARDTLFQAAVSDQNLNLWWVAPSYDDANDLGFEPLKRTLENMPGCQFIEDTRRAPPRKIWLTNGTEISFRSADRPESLVGRGVDYLVIDEAGSTKDHIWHEELRPTLSDTMGSMLAIGTPEGRNWFFDWFHRGQDGELVDTHSWRFTTYHNPHVKNSEIDSAREQLPERVFRQEYLAEFMEDEGAVFGRIKERNVQPYQLAGATGSAPYIIGIDLGRTENFTAITVLDVTGLLVHAERLRGGSWGSIGSAIQRVASQYAPCNLRIDATRDNALIERLQRKLPRTAIDPVRFSGQNKGDMIENLAARLELGEIMLPTDAGTLVSELTAYTYETTPSGNVRYTAPSGSKDDFVDSLALAAKRPETQSGAW